MVYAFRDRPLWAVIAAAIVLLHPAVIDVSAWWGQYESIYLFFALAAVVFALNGHNGLAAAALAVCLMTKPQALPFILPFAAWFWAHGGCARDRTDRGDRAGRHRGPVAAVHPGRTDRATTCTTSADYQNNIFPFLSLQRLERLVAGPAQRRRRVRRPTTTVLLGPLTLAHRRATALTGLLSLVVAPDHRSRSDATDVHPGPRRIDADLRSRS